MVPANSAISGLLSPLWVAPASFNFVVHAVHEGGGLNHSAGLFVHEFVYLARYPAGLQLQNGIGRDDVPSLAGMQRSDVDPRSALSVAGNSMQIQSTGSRGQQRVSSFFRGRTGMGWFSRECDIQFGGRQKLAGSADQVAWPTGLEADMPTNDIVHPLQNAGSLHGGCASATLFRRAEKSTSPSPKVAF